MPKVKLYTDGGAEPNPGTGGWAAVALFGDSGEQVELSGGAERTTNNRMELTAAIEGLEALAEGSVVDLYTDSVYLRRGITEWLAGWRKSGWRRRDGQPVKNVDLWRRLAEVVTRRQVRWHWVRGHAGDEHNERADALASAEIARRRKARPRTTEKEDGSGRQPAADLTVLLKVRSTGGRGAWSALVERDGERQHLGGSARGVTANRLELLAAIETLRSLPEDAVVEIRGGSDLLREGASSWIRDWKRKGWRTRSGDQVKSADLWRELERQLRQRCVRFAAPRPEDENGLAALSRKLRDQT